MDNGFADIGRELVETSKEASSARGMAEELFPYIYVAAKRMSTRAISRWLEEEKSLKISHVSISKALRNADEHFSAILENIWPSAQRIARECNLTAAEVLYRDDDAHLEVFLLEHDNPHPDSSSGIDAVLWSDTRLALKKLREEWFCYPVEVRAECSRFLENYEQEQKGEVE